MKRYDRRYDPVWLALDRAEHFCLGVVCAMALVALVLWFA